MSKKKFTVKANSSIKKNRVVKANNSKKRSRKIMAATDFSNPYIRIFLTNLGKYNEGELVGEWVDLPVDSFDDVKQRIGINGQYEEWFISDSETNVPGLSIGEYDNIDGLNALAEELEGLDEREVIIVGTYLERGYSVEDAIEKRDDGMVYTDCYDERDLGYAIVDEMGGIEQLGKNTLEMYFDYEGYGRDSIINGNMDYIGDGIYVELFD